MNKIITEALMCSNLTNSDSHTIELYQTTADTCIESPARDRPCYPTDNPVNPPVMEWSYFYPSEDPAPRNSRA